MCGQTNSSSHMARQRPARSVPEGFSDSLTQVCICKAALALAGGWASIWSQFSWAHIPWSLQYTVHMQYAHSTAYLNANLCLVGASWSSTLRPFHFRTYFKTGYSQPLHKHQLAIQLCIGTTQLFVYTRPTHTHTHKHTLSSNKDLPEYIMKLVVKPWTRQLHSNTRVCGLLQGVGACRNITASKNMGCLQSQFCTRGRRF